jgi:hypothetical protein
MAPATIAWTPFAIHEFFAPTTPKDPGRAGAE